MRSEKEIREKLESTQKFHFHDWETGEGKDSPLIETDKQIIVSNKKEYEIMAHAIAQGIRENLKWVLNEK